MVYKKLRCKSCGSQDFFLSEDAMRFGIYCNECGKWIKWANKDEHNLFLKCHLSAVYGKLAQNTVSEYIRKEGKI